MRLSRSLRASTAVAVSAAFLLTACSNNAETADTGDKASAAASPSASTSASSSASTEPATDASGEGTIPAGEPDVNGDGKVVVGVLSPGDLNDNGYYESFVTSAQAFTDKQGWKLIKVGSVNTADALEQARNLCRQGVDLLALAAAELADAIPASEEPVCSKVAWYVPSSAGNVKVTPKIALSSDVVNESLLAAGYAMGLMLQGNGKKTAGFVSGVEADFSTKAAKAYQAGIRQLVPDAKVVTTYTGDFNDSALAKEATQAQIDQGIGGLYPYLGGATDASAKLAASKGLPVATPGTDRCDSKDPKFAISVIFDPGYYFGAALEEFSKGKLAMGAVRTWHLGKDSVPTVKLCSGTAEQTQKLNDFMAKIGDGSVNPDAEVAKLGG